MVVAIFQRAQTIGSRILSFGVIPLILSAVLLSSFALPVVANSLQDSQLTERPATLVGPRADAPVPLYLRPAANQPSVGYGMAGSAVTVLEQVASFLPEADQDAAWNHIRLEEAPYTEGWVQGRFLLLSPQAESDTAQLSAQ
ncbi:MAG: hypothetical protein AAGL08_15720 [Cyanobacteria bacterium J06573_11]